MKGPPRVVVIAACSAASGAIAAHLLDRDRGRSRRARLMSRARAVPRRSVKRAISFTRHRASYVAGVAHGMWHRLVHRRGVAPPDDATLVQKIRSEVLGSEPFSHWSLSVDAVDGRVTIRGVLAEPADSEALAARIRRVAGVRDVANFVHAPGTPAPNKQAALATSTN